jgi:hypothetical protein
VSRRYARDEDTGERFLHRIECDAPGCRASIKPNPQIAESGWVKRGYGADVTADYCPDPPHLA